MRNFKPEDRSSKFQRSTMHPWYFPLPLPLPLPPSLFSSLLPTCEYCDSFDNCSCAGLGSPGPQSPVFAVSVDPTDYTRPNPSVMVSNSLYCLESKSTLFVHTRVEITSKRVVERMINRPSARYLGITLPHHF